MEEYNLKYDVFIMLLANNFPYFCNQTNMEK